ncbi:MAG: hypothetical protein OXJ52_05160 [Oligoflexia bacterium]|nr:hypothetical protein [Oligoflexia bacterium]
MREKKKERSIINREKQKNFYEIFDKKLKLWFKNHSPAKLILNLHKSTTLFHRFYKLITQYKLSDLSQNIYKWTGSVPQMLKLHSPYKASFFCLSFFKIISFKTFSFLSDCLYKLITPNQLSSIYKISKKLLKSPPPPASVFPVISKAYTPL